MGVISSSKDKIKLICERLSAHVVALEFILLDIAKTSRDHRCLLKIA
jgi:hypothetical protein